MDVYDRLADLTNRFARLLVGIDQQHSGHAVPGLDWTVGECAAHVQSVFQRMTGDRRRAADRAGLARLNGECNAEIGDDLRGIAGRIENLHTEVQRRAALVPPDRRFPFHAGLEVSYQQAGAVLVGELAVHGDDLSRATGRPWPLSEADVEPIWQYAVALLQGWLRPEARQVDEAWRLVVADGRAGPDRDRDLIVRICQGRLIIDRGTGVTAEHTVPVADLAAFTLAFPYRRRPIEAPEIVRLAALFEPI